ncbi:hypothetical protein BJ944DRAFT_264042 [Cunninghamella echinulata]|nr:hypothetical protein BJ944DRAFT_264042 [Cunninghamella echinulata]
MQAIHGMAHKLKEKVLLGVHDLTGQLLQESTPEEDRDEAALLAQSHRHGSFAPVRQHAKVKYYIDGHDYCWAVSEAIEHAKETIFIEDWWLTPELYLRRPPSHYPEYRVDALLKRKAEQGVKIFVVVYKEVSQAMTLDSRHTKDALQNLHENIVVLRHPDHDVGGTFFWSHHEKFVVIDNQIAFLGGIDLCFGRWDTHSHPLADFNGGKEGYEMFPGQDYSDARVRDFEDVKNWDRLLVDKTSVPRMPWHDISLCVVGEPVLDVARHFCERWNFVKSEKALDKSKVPFLQPPLGGFSRQTFKQPITEGLLRSRSTRFRHGTRGINGSSRAQVLRSSAQWSSGISLERSIQTAYISAITEAKHYVYIENQFFITATDNDPAYIIKNQIGAAIVKRIIRAHDEGEKFKVFIMMPLVPAFPADLSTKASRDAKAVMHYQYASISRGAKSICEKLRRAGLDPDNYIRFYSLRSYDRIHQNKLEEMMARAAGFTPDPSKVTEAEVEHTQINYPPQQPQPQQQSGNHHERPHKDHSFGSYPFPLPNHMPHISHHHLPRFPNPFSQDEDKNQPPPELYPPPQPPRQTVTPPPPPPSGPSDSISKHAMKGGNIHQEPWLSQSTFTSSDTTNSRHNDPDRQEASAYVSEELYIHAKLLIADDRLVIMGSANINDRSQCGDRDSEIALLVEDQDFIPSHMNGRQYEASRFAATLRRQLWKEHLGLLKDQSLTGEITQNMLPLPVPQLDETGTYEDQLVADPLNDAALDLWNTTAKVNTEAFREVFHCVPDDTVRNLDQYKSFYPDPNVITIGHVWNSSLTTQDIRNHLGKVRGHLVEFPTHFLEEEDLKADALTLTLELYT